MNDINNLFFELIRVALGNAVSLSHKPTEKEWKQLYDIAKKQSLVGICFAAVQRLPEDTRPPEMLYLTWMGMAAKIQQKNEQMNVRTKEALYFFREKGFTCQVLKGQGIAKLYGDLAGLRQSGDIDVWLAGGRAKVYNLSRDMLGKITGANYHHIHFPIWEETEIELHIWPSYLSSPLRHYRLHKFCRLYIPEDGCEDTPPISFNLVYILLHCYQHFSGHGVGFRQIMDYYFLLLQNPTDKEKKEAYNWIESLGMKKFAHALMWVLMEVFGLQQSQLLCDHNEHDGRFLLAEILETGNMGHQDKRVDKSKLQTAFGRYCFNMKRDAQMVRICPHEALWEPFWGIYQFCWRKLKRL